MTMLSSLAPVGISIARLYGANIDKKTVLETADRMISLGLRDAGYRYLVIGDGWAEKKRSADGSLVCDKAKFPEGLLGIADELHSRGLYLGIVTSAGVRTVNSFPGSHDSEYLDAEFFAASGVDYIMHDSCHIPGRADVQTIFRRMGFALRSAGRPIFYATACVDDKVHIWARSAGIGSYRGLPYADSANVSLPDKSIAGYSADYCWHDLGDITVCPDKNADSLKAELTAAAMMCSPIIIDCDLEALDTEKLAVMKNADVLRFAFDPEGRPARCLSGENSRILVKLLDEKEYAVAFVNMSENDETMTLYAFDFGLTGTCGLLCDACEIYTAEAFRFDDCLEVTVGARSASVFKVKLIEKRD